MLERLAVSSSRHRVGALVAWVLVVVAVSAASSGLGSDYRNDFTLPGTDSQAAADALGPGRDADSVQVVLAADGALDEARVGRVLDPLDGLAGVADVGEAIYAEDRRIAYATVTLEGLATDVGADDVRALVDAAREGAGDGVRVELGGEAVRNAQEGGGGAAEGAGMLAALVILVLLFGSLLAASLPLVTAAFAVATALGLIALASNLIALPDFAPPMMLLVGLGVGIDYALLIFSRFRAELLGGAAREDAVRRALATAGHAVVLACGTVVIALLGLVVLGIGSLQGVALAVALTVLVTMVASITLLPALLHALGPRLERRLRRRADRGDGERWRSIATAVQRRPLPVLVVTALTLAALAVPALDLRLGFSDSGTDAEADTTRQAYDLLAAGFGPGTNGPLVVVVRGGDPAPVRRGLEAADGIASVSTAGPPGGGVATLLALPETAPQDEATGTLVTTLREDVLPPLAREAGGTVHVGGPTAAQVDFTDTVSSRVPLFLAVVVGLSALLLALVFRSVLIPVKAAVLNLLTIGASLGVVGLVFEGGGPIEAFLPVIVFAVVFGLSMDYEVFLVSRMREVWLRTGDSSLAVREGLAHTGRVITAAGAIMVVVFGSFVLAPERFLQQMGLGMAVAILLDAFVVRCLLVPAAMQLLGDRAWWWPARRTARG